MTSVNFSDLDDFDTAKAHQGAQEQPKFPCIDCAGSGKWTSYSGMAVGKCRACLGRGYFLTSPKQRQQAQAGLRKRRAEDAKTRLEAWAAKHPEKAAYLAHAATWSEFAFQLLAIIKRIGTLTDKQMAAIESMMDKCPATPQQPAQVVDLTKINQLFDIAIGNGIQKPVLRVGALAISIAPSHGKNAGYLYIKDGGEYAGKISPEGGHMPTKEAREGIVGELQAIAADPMGQATLHGKKTGRCACCGRELTDPDSIALGIGPVCVGKWGL